MDGRDLGQSALETLLGRASGDPILLLVDERLRILRAGPQVAALAERDLADLPGLSLIAAFGSAALDAVARAAAAEGEAKTGEAQLGRLGQRTFQVDAVLLYAHPGNGRRANLFTDYTFGLWEGDALLPVAKAYSGLSDAEIRELDGWVRSHTVQRFGPVRAVEPTQVFELHFEGIARSTRHKSGVAVRFPRIARWRTDKPASEADTLETLRRMIPTGAAVDPDPDAR